MHFIDVGFKQSGSSENNKFISETVLYGLTDVLEEIDLFKRIEIEQNGKKEVEEIKLTHLDSNALDSVKKILMNKKECGDILNEFSIMLEDNTRKITIEKYDYLIAKKYDFSEKLSLLKEVNREIIDNNALLSIEKLINYDKIFGTFDSNGDYAIYMLWLIERHLMYEENINSITKINKHLNKILAFLASKIKDAEIIADKDPKELCLNCGLAID